MESDIWQLTGETGFPTIAALEQAVETVADRHGLFPPTLSYFEQDGREPWKIDLYFAGEPDTDFIREILDTAGLADLSYTLDKVEERDWVTESQKAQPPVVEGQFFIYGSHDADKVPDSALSLLIDAGQAFGTGQHETTSACLNLLDGITFEVTRPRILDLGTGTGVLAFAAKLKWQKSRVLATDIDPVAIDVTRQNLTVNTLTERMVGADDGQVALAVADGFDAPCFAPEGPFDLILANILAGPLIDLAPDVVQATCPGGQIILSGLLNSQASDVITAYEAAGMQLVRREDRGEWTALHLSRPA